MSINRKDEFIENLVATHRPCRPLLLPVQRALIWFAIVVPTTALLMRFVQAFRPGCMSQLLQHPVFLVEIVSALLLVLLGAYIAAAQAVPGCKISLPLHVQLTGAMVALSLCIVGGFAHLGPESSTLGARHSPGCWLEVLVYGTLVLALFAFLIRRGYVRFSPWQGMLYGLVAGLIPAVLMQLACMYDPHHGLMFHYAPVVIVMLLGILVSRCVRR